MTRTAAIVSILLHAAAGVAIARARPRPAPAPRVRVQVAVVQKPARPPPPPERPAEPPPPREVHQVKLARAPIGRSQPLQRPLAQPAPPPPSASPAPATDDPPVVIAGITYESTSASGSFAVATGNTLSAAPERVAHAPSAVHPYKAPRFAPAADLAEPPQVLNRDAVDIRRYYPKQALQRGFEGEVVLRLTIDADGSIAEASVVRDPGEGLGEAALRAVHEFRFAPGKTGDAAVATSIPFVIRFVIS